jgi:hypothetical protein
VNIHTRVIGADRVKARFRRDALKTATQVRGVVRHYGHLLTTRIKAKASGRPGPNVVTGDYRRSWTTQFRTSPGFTMSVSGTNAPQARRLEFGFHGADSLGRVYDQPPFPHAYPALDEVGPEFERALAAIRDGVAS